MKKKISLMLLALLAILMLCACGKDPKTVDYNGKSYDDLQQEAVQNATMTHFIAAYAQGNDLSDEDISAAKEQGFTDISFEGYKTWFETEAKYGDCTQITGLEQESEESLNKIYDTFAVTKAGNTLTTDITLEFGSKAVIYELVYDYYDMSITNVSINPVQTMGEKMKSAGQNTIISLAIVFFVLILISLIIKGFIIFSKIEEKKAKKAKAIEEANKAQIPANVIPEPIATTNNKNLMDDLELVAVITAAIAASEGTSADGFVVRSINRR